MAGRKRPRESRTGQDMALSHRRFRQITREMLYGWLQEYQALPAPKPTKRQFLIDKIEGVTPGLSDTAMDMSQRDDYEDDEVPFIRVVMDDLKSYG